jgi:hypothetical protein
MDDIPIIRTKRPIEIQNGPHAGQTHEFEEPVRRFVGVPLPEWNYGRGMWVAIYRVSPLGGRAELDDILLEDMGAPVAAPTTEITV